MRDVLTTHLPAVAGIALRPRLGRARLLAFQAGRLQRLVAHAHARVPYYRDLFERHRLRPTDIRTLADLRAIPITEKRDLQGLPVERVVARDVDADRLIVHRSSGASGEPFAVRRTWFEDRVLGAFRWRARLAMGVRARDHVVALSTRARALPRDHQWPQRMVHALGLYRWTRIHGMREPSETIADLRVLRPDVMSGYAGTLWRIGQALSAGDRAALRPRIILTGGDILAASTRRDIAAAFGATVLETYGAEECNLIAWECPRSARLHTCDDSVLVEVLRDGRPASPGERGEVVITSLHAFAMPIIRYRLGDVVTRGDETCACGSPFASIETVHGRIVDHFTLPDGRVVNAGPIVTTLGQAPRPWLRQFRVLQERTDLVILSLVAAQPPTAAELSEAEHAVRTVVGPAVEVRSRLVSEIPPEPSGKFRPIHSLVTPSPHDATEPIV